MTRRTQIFTIVYVALIAAVAVVAYMQGKNQSAELASNEQVHNEASEQPADETASWKTYADSKAGFSIKYPDAVFRLQTMRQNLPGSPARIATPTLVHSIQMEHCDLSGVCVPATEDITLGFIVLDKPLDKATAENTAYGEFEDIKIGDVNAKVTVGQAEGEGIYFYFIALSANKTLVILRSFIDENAILNYQTAEASAKGFIKVAEQEKLFEKIMETFKFTK